MTSVARTRRGLRLLPVPGVAWATAGLATLVPQSATMVSAVGWFATAVAMILVVVRRRTWIVVAVLAFAAAASVASHVALATPARADAIEHVGGGGRSVDVTATVVGKVERWSNGTRAFDALARDIRVGSTSSARPPLPITVLIPASGGLPVDVDVGAVVSFSGSAHVADPGERAVFEVTAGEVSLEHEAEGPAAVAASLRHGLLRAAAGLPEPGAGLIAGLAVGDTSLVRPELDAAMKASSLSHLTAVSGANCALVVGIAFALAALAGAPRWARVAAGGAALAGFVVLVTPEPSVARAAVMAAVAMIAVAIGRPAVGVSVLSLAVTALLIGDPWLATSLGFALSAAATGALLLLARPLAAGMQRWMPRSLALALSVPLSAQFVCGPLLVLIAPTVPLYGVVANLLAAPAAPLATVVGLAACLALPMPALQSGLTAIAWLPAAWIAATADVFAHLPGGQVAWVEGWAGAAALAAVGGVVVVLVLRHVRRPLRLVAGGVAALLAGAAAGGAVLGGVAAPLTLPAGWSVLACDVGQGDAVLLRSAGDVALVDTGPDPEALDRCLRRAGVEEVDVLFLTHFDLDHAGGVRALVGRVAEVRHGPPASLEHERLLDDLASAGARVVPAWAGQHGVVGDAEWSVRWPPHESRAFPDGNDASVVLDVSGGGLPHTLLLGDLSASPQQALAASRSLQPPYDVVKVAHHGSADQAPSLYGLIQPAIAVVTVGQDNDYGHPRTKTLELLDDLGAVILRTDVDGAVALWRSRDGPAGAMAVWRERVGDVAPAD